MNSSGPRSRYTMNYDSFFTMGKTHNVCQDYALHGPGYAIVSDGCSGSPDTDFGSRFMAFGAKKSISIENNEAFVLEALKKAVEYGRSLELNSNHLDATLLAARVIGTNVNALMAGDGIIAAKNKDGIIVVIEVNYAGGAPLYLNYLNDTDRLAYLRESYDLTKTIKKTLIYNDGVDMVSELKSVNLIESFDFPIAEYDFVSVMTDGATQFQKQMITQTSKTYDSVNTIDVIRELMNIKGVVGPFVERRCKAFLRDCTRNGTIFNDDFSIATIYTGE